MKKWTITYWELGNILTDRLNKLIKQEEKKEKMKKRIQKAKKNWTIYSSDGSRERWLDALNDYLAKNS